jgi:predicted aspartyl protease
MVNDMGKVITRIKVENWSDTEMVAAGYRKEKPRSVETDALVDTGAVKFYLKTSVIQQLGLRAVGEIKSRTMSDRTETRKVYSPAFLEIQGRSGRFDVIEVPDSLPNIVGQIPLEDLDWVVDCRNQKLIPNPEHKHGEMCEDY